jgi:hypothetical protein
VYKDIDDVEDVEFLKNNKISEDIDLDYKSKLPVLSNEESRLDFLRDICSFANTHGGQVIFGVQEERGKAIPQSIDGITLLKPDYEIRQFEDIVRNGLEQVVSGIYFKLIPMSGDQYIVVLKIPKSLYGPHRVKGSLDKDHRFYGRNSLQKYELSFLEIRDQFMLSGSIQDKIRKFREDRINVMQSGDFPTELESGPKIALHIVPLSAYATNAEIDLIKIKALYQTPHFFNNFSPLGRAASGRHEITLDGFLTYFSDSKTGYVHFYREGIIEAVSVLPVSGQDEQLVHSGSYEMWLLKQKYLNILKEVNISPPFCIFLSLLDVNGYSLATSSNAGFYGAYQPSHRAYNKVNILLKEVILESFEESLEKLFKPLFDRFCNAWGFSSCPHYNEDGAYKFN